MGFGHRNANAAASSPSSSFQAEGVIGTGRGALIVGMFGAGWFGWGLGEAKAFNGFVGPVFGFIELFLLACSIYVIRKGSLLRKQYPPVPASTRRAIRKSFLLVVLIEVLALVLVSILAYRIRRPDLRPTGLRWSWGSIFCRSPRFFARLSSASSAS